VRTCLKIEDQVYFLRERRWLPIGGQQFLLGEQTFPQCGVIGEMRSFGEGDALDFLRFRGGGSCRWYSLILCPIALFCGHPEGTADPQVKPVGVERGDGPELFSGYQRACGREEYRTRTHPDA
jgi:hypothetical protein